MPTPAPSTIKKSSGRDDPGGEAAKGDGSKGAKPKLLNAMTQPMTTPPRFPVIYLSTLIPFFAAPGLNFDQLRTVKRNFKNRYQATYPLGHSAAGRQQQDPCFYLSELPALVPLLLHHFKPPASWQANLIEAIRDCLLLKDAKTWFVLGTEHWQPFPEWTTVALPDGRKTPALSFLKPRELQFRLKDLCMAKFWTNCVARDCVSLVAVVAGRPSGSEFTAQRDIRASLLWCLQDKLLQLKPRHVEFIANNSIEEVSRFYQQQKSARIRSSDKSAVFATREKYFQAAKRQRMSDTDEDGELQWRPDLYVRILDRCLSLQACVQPTRAQVERAIIEEFASAHPYLNHSAYAETAGIYPEICRLARDCTFLVS
jgi:hypothetical protein